MPLFILGVMLISVTSKLIVTATDKLQMPNIHSKLALTENTQSASSLIRKKLYLEGKKGK